MDRHEFAATEASDRGSAFAPGVPGRLIAHFLPFGLILITSFFTASLRAARRSAHFAQRLDFFIAEPANQALLASDKQDCQDVGQCRAHAANQTWTAWAWDEISCHDIPQYDP